MNHSLPTKNSDDKEKSAIFFVHSQCLDCLLTVFQFFAVKHDPLVLYRNGGPILDHCLEITDSVALRVDIFELKTLRGCGHPNIYNHSAAIMFMILNFSI